MQNRHPGNCEACRTRVPAGAGIVRKIGGGWIVFCAAHADGVPVSAPGSASATAAVLTLVIRVWLSAADRVLCSPVDRLGNSFEKYIAATRQAGFGFSRADNAQVGTVAKSIVLIDALRAAGFTPDVSPELLAQLQVHQAKAQSDVTAAQGRAVQVNALLAERGLGLMGFQNTGIEWLAPRQKAVLGDDMGLGKTIQALTAAPVGAPMVVVCPAVAKGVWLREASRFRPDLTPVALSGRGSFRWAQPGEIVIVNYDILPGEKAEDKGMPATLPASLAQAPNGTVLVGDEAHALKASDTTRTSQFRALRQAALAAKGRVWLLTATPILNRPTELWALLQAMDAGREVFGSYQRFQRLWNAEQGRYGVIWGQAQPEVAQLMQGIMLRRMKRDVLTQLPPKTVRTVEVNGLSDSVKRLCDATLAQLEADGISVERALATATDTADRRPSFTGWSKARAALALAKLGAAEQMIESFEDAEEPVVVFSAHRAPIDTLGKREGWAAITGDTPGEEREAIAARFQAGQLKGIAATIAAGGVAITLTRASNAIFIDEEETPALNVQAQDRIYRIGQSRGVVITRLVATHALDRRIAELLATKDAIIASGIDAAVRRPDEVVSSVPVVDTATILADNVKAVEAEVAVIEAERAIPAPVIPASSPIATALSEIDCALTELRASRATVTSPMAAAVIDRGIRELTTTRNAITATDTSDYEIPVADSCPF